MAVMYRDTKGKSRGKVIRTRIAYLCLVVIIVAACMSIVRSVSLDMDYQATRSLEKTVLSTAVQCYAIEGAYPESLEYLERYYGLQINHQDYIVTYEVFGSNVMPTVQVLMKKSAGGGWL